MLFRRKAILKLVYILTIIAMIFAIPLAWAQDEMPPADPASVEVELQPSQPEIVQPKEPPPPPPSISPDTEIFRRTPAVNGQIEQGEWDEFFHFEYIGLEAWAYVDWDSDNLYIGAKSNEPTDLLVTLDGNDDGWFHGADNYEFVIRRGVDGGSPTLSVSKYESKGKLGAGGAPLTAAEAAAFILKSGESPDSYVYEIAIPKASAPGLELRPGKKIGLKVAIGAGDEDLLWIPTAPLGDVQTAEMVNVKSAATGSLFVDVALSDRRVAPGEELSAKITIKNKGDMPSSAECLVIGGEGKTAQLLGSRLVRIEGIDPGKSFKSVFRTPIPRSATPGSSALGIEVRSEGETLATTLISFDIVPTLESKLELGDGPVKLDEYRRIAVIIRNNTSKDTHGKVRLILPEGWSFKWSNGTKDFYIRQEDGEQAIVFRVKPPERIDKLIPVLAEIQVGDSTISVSGMLQGL